MMGRYRELMGFDDFERDYPLIALCIRILVWGGGGFFFFILAGVVAVHVLEAAFWAVVNDIKLFLDGPPAGLAGLLYWYIALSSLATLLFLLIMLFYLPKTERQRREVVEAASRLSSEIQMGIHDGNKDRVKGGWRAVEAAIEGNYSPQAEAFRLLLPEVRKAIDLGDWAKLAELREQVGSIIVMKVP